MKRMKLDYVDIFYHHIRDKDTPMEETAMALDSAVRQGKRYTWEFQITIREIRLK